MSVFSTFLRKSACFNRQTDCLLTKMVIFNSPPRPLERGSGGEVNSSLFTLPSSNLTANLSLVILKNPRNRVVNPISGCCLHIKSEGSEYRCDGREDEIYPHRPLVLCVVSHVFLLS